MVYDHIVGITRAAVLVVNKHRPWAILFGRLADDLVRIALFLALSEGFLEPTNRTPHYQLVLSFLKHT